MVKALGDAVLLVFDTPIQAVLAVRALNADVSDLAQETGLSRAPLSAAITYGPVRENWKGDVFGAVVNLAARLEGMASAGEILLDEPVADAVRDKIEITDRGEHAVKGYQQPVRRFSTLL